MKHQAVLLKIPNLPGTVFVKNMSVQEDFRKKNKPVNVRAIFDVVMGLIYAAVGGAMAASRLISLELNLPGQEAIPYFGAAALLYGCFRVYRGYKLYKSERL